MMEILVFRPLATFCTNPPWFSVSRTDFPPVPTVWSPDWRPPGVPPLCVTIANKTVRLQPGLRVLTDLAEVQAGVPKALAPPPREVLCWQPLARWRRVKGDGRGCGLSVSKNPLSGKSRSVRGKVYRAEYSRHVCTPAQCQITVVYSVRARLCGDFWNHRRRSSCLWGSWVEFAGGRVFELGHGV